MCGSHLRTVRGGDPARKSGDFSVGRRAGPPRQSIKESGPCYRRNRWWCGTAPSFPFSSGRDRYAAPPRLRRQPGARRVEPRTDQHRRRCSTLGFPPQVERGKQPHRPVGVGGLHRHIGSREAYSGDCDGVVGAGDIDERRIGDSGSACRVPVARRASGAAAIVLPGKCCHAVLDPCRPRPVAWGRFVESGMA
jgi:hypothetical protein